MFYDIKTLTIIKILRIKVTLKNCFNGFLGIKFYHMCTMSMFEACFWNTSIMFYDIKDLTIIKIPRIRVMLKNFINGFLGIKFYSMFEAGFE